MAAGCPLGPLRDSATSKSVSLLVRLRPSKLRAHCRTNEKSPLRATEERSEE
jgi:hypothetical protein